MRICCVEVDSPLDILEFTAALLVLLLLTVDLWSLVIKMKAQDSFLFEEKKKKPKKRQCNFSDDEGLICKRNMMAHKCN